MTTLLPLGTEMRRDAVLSDDLRYRYSLTRSWGAPDVEPSTVTWVMLNPGVADARVDDQTIRRCVGFAREWGFSAMRVVNLFALRATDPGALAAGDDPVGPDNDAAIDAAAAESTLVVCGWGAHPFAEARAVRVAIRLRAAGHLLHCVGHTRSWAPRHPLYAPSAVPLELL